MSAGGVLRIVRAAMFAAVCVVLAAVGHVLMSGTGLPWWVLGPAASAVGVVGWAFGARERGGRTVAALTVGVQTCLHLCFTLAQSAPSSGAGARDAGSVQAWARHLLCGENPTPAQAARAYDIAAQAGLIRPGHVPSAPDAAGTATAAGHGVHAGAGLHEPAGITGLHGMTGMHGMAGTASWGMLAAHVLAAVLCGLWLAQGERAAFALLRACADRAFVPLRLVLAVLLPLAARPALRPRPRPCRRLRHLLLGHSVTTRGPPGAIAVV
ncbi:hypothetical protein ACFVGX_09530 [Streptomyces sp. NPDC127113]|uniref:hypothetical protein n=1 Tax=unclassified Streptomyces TaxID=2593676 RepID=UPI0033B99753